MNDYYLNKNKRREKTNNSKANIKISEIHIKLTNDFNLNGTFLESNLPKSIYKSL